jgi:argininosuccinate lyase
MKQLWVGRLDGKLDARAAALNASLPFDRRLALQDVRGSIAWAEALARAGVLTEEEMNSIRRGLADVEKELAEDTLSFSPADEDIHTAVERRLGELIGETAGKLHTGRSRNDQVAADFRLWTMETAERTAGDVRDVQRILVTRAEQDFGIVLPGYTHTQRAQPVLLSHWWLSHFWALERDVARLHGVRAQAAVCPLGSGALAGTAFPVDREALARALGFDSASPNSLDAVADRDFAAEFLFAAALLGVHLSRLADALILFSTAEFGFVEMSDAFATGSSLMPQKKNADMLELTRGKTGKLIGLLTGWLATLKGLPSAYDKDLQEDKPAVFETADTLAALLPVVGGVIETLTLNPDRMLAAIDDTMLATDLADYLVARGVPFRSAHAAAGKAVRRSLELGVRLSAMPHAEFQAIHPSFGPDLAGVFDRAHMLERRGARGGTAPAAVRQQIAEAKKVLSHKE